MLDLPSPFKGSLESADYLYKKSKIDKLKNIIIKANCRLVYDQLKNNLPETFSNFFTLNIQLHKQNTRKKQTYFAKGKDHQLWLKFCYNENYKAMK